MKDEGQHEAPGLGGDFPGREKQDVFPAASTDGFTAARKIPSQSRRRGLNFLRVIRSQRITLAWLALLAATLISWGFGHGRGLEAPAAGIAVIVIAFVKIRYVILDFMELRTAPPGMRVAVEAWCIVVCTTLVLLYGA
jgi:hypothetical protein